HTRSKRDWSSDVCSSDLPEPGGLTMEGLIHIYCGDGKGKTTAAVGLAVRAAGAGKRVIFTQFFKDGSSSEIKMLETLPGVELVQIGRASCRERVDMTLSA